MTTERIKLAFVVNDVATEQDNYSTIRLARRAVMRGHEVALIGLGDFIYDWEDGICAMAILSKIDEFEDDTVYLAHLQDTELERTRIVLSEWDILMLRSDPAEELVSRSWAPTSSLLFAQLASLERTIVLNDPRHLTDAVNKTYFQGFPESVRPATTITREPEEVRRFLDAPKKLPKRSPKSPRKFKKSKFLEKVKTFQNHCIYCGLSTFQHQAQERSPPPNHLKTHPGTETDISVSKVTKKSPK